MVLELPPAPRILLVVMSALGDVVHALPVVTALKRHRPRAHLTWVLQPGPASLVGGHPDVDEIIVYHRSQGLRALAATHRRVAAGRYDLVIDLQVYLKASIVTAVARAPVKLGFDRARARDLNWLFTNRKIPPHAPQHVQDQYFEFLAALGVPAEPVEWKLGPWPQERQRQRELFGGLDRPVVALVIGSSRAEKEWVPDRWADLADALHADFGLQPVLVGGRSPRELETEREILARARRPVRSTLGVSLRDLVAVLEGAALVVSVDTGPMHVAVAVDTPVIALSGALSPARVGPYRKYRDLIVDRYHDEGEAPTVTMAWRTGRMERISVADVLEKVGVWRERYAPAGGDR